MTRISKIIIAGMILLISCSPYENGPAFCLKSKTNRLTGKWIIDTYFVEDKEQELDETLESFLYTLHNDGSGTLTGIYDGYPVNEILQWEFADKNKKIKLRMKTPENGWSDWQVSKILRLSSKELQITSSEETPLGEKKMEMHYRKLVID